MQLNHVVIWPGNIRGNKWVSFAQEIKEQTGAQCSVLCSLPQDIPLYKKIFKGITEDIEAVIPLYDVLDSPLNGSERLIEEQAVACEATYGTLMTDLIQSDRHLGLAYSTSGTLYPRSRLGAKATYVRSLRTATHMLKFFDQYFQKRGTELLLMDGSGALHTKSICVVAESKGIPIRCLAPSRYKNLVHWAGNDLFEVPWLTEAFDQLSQSGGSLESGFDGPYLASAVERKRQSKMMGLAGTLKYCSRDVARFIYQRIIRYKPYAGNYLRDTLAYRIRAYSRHKWLEKHTVKSLQTIQQKPYVFFPLNHEPEASLSVMSPEFNNQMAVIDLVSKALPADYRLVVKEHETAGIAARPKGFYPWLKAIPNVVMANMHLTSIPLIQGSAATVVLTGTAGMEAAVCGVPVITFSSRNMYNCIPHVHLVDRISDIRPLVAQVCQSASHESRQKRLQDGRRFMDAMKSISYDLEHDEAFAQVPQISQKNIKQLIQMLVKTLERDTVCQTV